MPISLTLKNIPDDLYERLKAVAAKNRRSMNSEAIVCLEAVLMPDRVGPDEHLARARQIRAELKRRGFRAGHISAAKRRGRP
jgi:plasmid stability protein